MSTYIFKRNFRDMIRWALRTAAANAENDYDISLFELRKILDEEFDSWKDEGNAE